jgi:hypothetical protein
MNEAIQTPPETASNTIDLAHIAASPLLRASRTRSGDYTDCANCGRSFYRYPCESNRLFCDPECANTFKRKYIPETRTCNQCGSSFTYRDRPNSNNAGKYCSVECRNTAYLGNYKGRPMFGFKGHRAGWRSIRDRFILSGNDFCCRCGARPKRLYVHHVEPYRIRQNNDVANLVTLCSKCHPKLEAISDIIEAMPEVRRPMAVMIVQAELQDLWYLNHGKELLAA